MLPFGFEQMISLVGSQLILRIKYIQDRIYLLKKMRVVQSISDVLGWINEYLSCFHKCRRDTRACVWGNILLVFQSVRAAPAVFRNPWMYQYIRQRKSVTWLESQQLWIWRTHVNSWIQVLSQRLLTRRIKSVASADTLLGIRKSSCTIRRYVAREHNVRKNHVQSIVGNTLTAIRFEWGAAD